MKNTMSEEILVEHDEEGSVTQTPFKISQEEFDEFKVRFEKTFGKNATVDKRGEGFSIEILDEKTQKSLPIRVDHMDIRYVLKRWDEWYKLVEDIIRSS